MTNETHRLMQHEDSRDTGEMSKLKRLFWELENFQRAYPHLREDTIALQEEIITIVEVMDDWLKEHKGVPVNQELPREPLPTDKEGKLSSGKMLREALTAHDNKDSRSNWKDAGWLMRKHGRR